MVRTYGKLEKQFNNKENAQLQSVLINLFSCFGLITVDLLVVLKRLERQYEGCNM